MKLPNHFSARQLVVAGVLAATGAFAFAQGTPPAPTAAPTAPAAERRGPPPEARQHRGPEADKARAERMAAFHAKREAEFKTRLQLTPQQEAAWTSFSAAMKPPAGGPRAQRPDREAFAKLTTPQRLDRMQQLKAQRDAEMAKRADATRTFYAQLNPSQQKVFDQETLRMGHHGGPRHGHGHGPHGGFGGEGRDGGSRPLPRG